MVFYTFHFLTIFIAPEVVVQGKASVASDLFSLGVLLFNCHRKDEPLISAKTSVSKYKEMVGQSSYASFFHLPSSLQDILPQLIKSEPNYRLKEDGLLNSPYFSDLQFRYKSLFLH